MAARERLTERGYNPKTGSMGKQADPYLMNQERRPQSEPAADQYESGNPSTWAEDVNEDDLWKQEYEKGRNEVGMGNFLDSTWKDREHPGTPGAPRPQYENKTANEALKLAAEERAAQMATAKKLASKALHLAHALFPQASEKFVMAQARDFMQMPEAALDATIARIVRAADEEEVEVEEEEKEEKKEEKEASLNDRIASLRKRLAAVKQEVTAADDEDDDEGDKEASLQMIANLEERLAALERRGADEEEVEVEEETDKEALTRGLDVLAGRKRGGEEEEEAEEEAEEAEEEAEEAEEEAEEAKESSLAELDIELTPAEMNTTAGDGDLLDDIFMAAEQQKTASDKPKKGVSKLGGGGKTASASEMDLSGLWKSDPDVSKDFQ